MEHQQHSHSFNSSRANSKLPLHLPPSCASSLNSANSPTHGTNKYTSIERKSIVRMTSNEPLDDDSSTDDRFIRHSLSNFRRSQNKAAAITNIDSERSDMRLLDFGSNSHISQLLDRLDSLSLSNLHQINPKSLSHRVWPQTSITPNHSPMPGNSTSGYDSNSSSSLLSGYFYPLGSSGASTSNTTIRRIPSVPNLRPSSVASSVSSSMASSSMASSSIASSSGSSQCTNTGKATIVNNNKKMPIRPNSTHVGKEINLKDEIIRTTDKIEKRVSFLREVAQELLSERNKLDNAIQQVKQYCVESNISDVELEEISAAVGLLQRRLEAVNIEICTPRSNEQTKALNRANKYIDELRELVKHKQNILPNDNKILNNQAEDLPPNLRFARQRCLSYISSCSSDGVPETPATPIDEKFQQTVIECTAEDQKQIRRALEAIFSQLNQNEKFK